jgi:thiosulfate/3-mercaptopyruvate sulfurtransferase
MVLISAAELVARHTSVRLLDARPDAAAYLAGHLPGALHADLNHHLSTAADPGHDPAHGGRHPLPPVVRFAAQLGAWGIGPATDVVIYDAAGGGNAAARAWWMLRAMGHQRVQVLDGGMKAAVEAGLVPAVETSVVAPLPPYPATSWSSPLVDMEAVERLRSDPAHKVLDVRSAERWRGQNETFDPVAGHIPGAVNLPWNDNLAPDGRFKPAAALRAQYQALLGETPPDQLAVHCGSGVTACHTLLALEVAGLRGAALYVGSWSEWCRSGRPLSTSIP